MPTGQAANIKRLHPARVSRGIWLRFNKWRARSIRMSRLEEARLGVDATTFSRSEWRVDNFLRTLSEQTLPSNMFDIVLVDFASEPGYRADLVERCRRYGVRLLDVWSVTNSSCKSCPSMLNFPP